MFKQFGIDISKWQGNFDLSKAKANGANFVILKCGGSDNGIYTDTSFNKFYKSAKAIELPVGCYWFSNALSVSESTNDAKYMIDNVLKGKKFELPIYIDVETKQQLSLPKKTLTDIVITWCECMKKNGYYPGIYASKWTFTDNLEDDRLKDYPHWIAQWDTSCTYKGEYGMWQFGGEYNKIQSTKFCGQTIDQDYMLVDYPSFIKQNGLNGYVKEEEPMTSAEKKEFESLKAKVETLTKTIDKYEKEKVYDNAAVKWTKIDNNFPSWAKSTITKLKEKGYLNGNSNNSLELSYLMLRVLVILDRAGNFDK